MIILPNSQTMNLYSYVGNNPINNIDPLGLWTLGLNIGVSIGCGSGFYGSITIDDDFDFGIIASYGVTDEVNSSAGGNVFLQYTDADNIKRYRIRGMFGYWSEWWGRSNSIWWRFDYR